MTDMFASADVPAADTIVVSGDYKATDPTTVVLRTKGATSLRVNCKASANSGGGGVTITISGVDPASGLLYTLLASALITDTAMHTYIVDPRILAATNLNAQAPMPAVVKVAFVGSGTRTTLTYSASAELAN